MILSLNNLMENLNEEGVELIYNCVGIFELDKQERYLTTTSPERIVELKAIEEKGKKCKEQEKELKAIEVEEYRNEYLTKHSKLYKTIEQVKIENLRYDLGIEDIEAIDFKYGNIKNIFPQYVFEASYDFFKYGFLKGTRFAANEAKRKMANATK